MRKVFGAIIIVVFTGFTNIRAQTVDKIIGVVGGSIILQSEAEMQYAQYLTQGNAPDPEIKCSILQTILSQKLLAQQAVIDSVTVTDEDVDAAIDNRMRNMISRAGGQERLEQFLKRSVLQFKDEIRADIREQLIANKMHSKIIENIAVTPEEVKRFYGSIPKDSLPTYNTEVEVGEIVVYPKLTKEEKQVFRDKAEKLLKEIKGGADFATWAKLYSQDGSAVEGGELGFMDRTQLVKEFAAVAFRLKAGEISPVFETQFGFHILQVIERRGEQVHTRHILIKTEPTPASLDRAKAHADSIYNDVLNKKLSFSAAAGQYSDNVDTKYNGGILLNAEEVERRSTTIPTDKLDPQIFLIIDTMKIGSYSVPSIFNSPDQKKGYHFLYLKSKTEPHSANLEQDFPKIKAAALSDKIDRTLSEWFEKRRKSTYIRIDKEYQSCGNLKLWISEKPQTK